MRAGAKFAAGYAVVALLLVALPAPAPATELRVFYQTPRALGMGGAFTAVSDDEGALFYNAAGLDKVRGIRMGILNPLVETNRNGINAYEDQDDTDLDNTAQVTELLRKHMGENLHVRAALFPFFAQRHFAFGLLGQVTADAEVRNTAFPEVEVDALGTGSGHLGIGYGFHDNVLRVGGALKYVSATRLHQTYTAADIAAENFDDRVEEDRKSGSGLGVDLGAMVTFPGRFEPTVALALLDVADTRLGDAGKIPMRLNLGLSATARIPWLTVVGAFDWVDVTNRLGDDSDVFKRLHAGVEARLPKILAVRAGLSQGYGTLGATLSLGVVKLEYATYAAELGSAAGDRPDRRHTAQLSLGW